MGDSGTNLELQRLRFVFIYQFFHLGDGPVVGTFLVAQWLPYLQLLCVVDGSRRNGHLDSKPEIVKLIDGDPTDWKATRLFTYLITISINSADLNENYAIFFRWFFPCEWQFVAWQLLVRQFDARWAAMNGKVDFINRQKWHVAEHSQLALNVIYVDFFLLIECLCVSEAASSLFCAE